MSYYYGERVVQLLLPNNIISIAEIECTLEMSK